MLRSFLFAITFFVSTASHAWVVSTEVTIKELVQWEGSSYVLVILSNNNMCHAPLTDKELYSFMLSLYMAGKKFTAYCHDGGETINGYNDSHKIHRINAM